MGGVGVPVRGQQRLLRMLMGAAWTLECALGFSKKKKDAQGVELGTFQNDSILHGPTTTFPTHLIQI